MATQISIRVDKAAIVLLDDLSASDKELCIVGVALEYDDIGLDKILRTKLTKTIKPQEGGGIFVELKDKNIDEFRELVLQNYANH